MAKSGSAIIIGGGVIGMTSAYTLARSGWQVTILDRNHEPARETSWGNARQLSYGHTNALANARMLSHIPNIVMGRDPGLAVKLRPDRQQTLWFMRFLANCNDAAFNRSTLAVLEMAKESSRAMNALLARHPIAFERRKVGKLVVLRSARQVEEARENVEMRAAAGAQVELVGHNQLMDIEPALAHSPKPISGAVYTPQDESGNCNLFCNGLLKVLTEQYGAIFRGGVQVSKLKYKRGRWTVQLKDAPPLSADLVVVATGHNANQLLNPLGLAQPIQPMKGYSFTAPAGANPPLCSITDPARRIVFTNIGDRVLVAGFAEMGNDSTDVEPERLEAMKRAAIASLPKAAIYEEADEGWAGLRPMAPDSTPIIRELRPGLIVNIGHGMLGWTLAMGAAERLAQCAERVKQTNRERPPQSEDGAETTTDILRGYFGHYLGGLRRA